MSELRILQDHETVSRAASEAFVRLAADDGPLDWNRVHLFWGDERHVPPLVARAESPTAAGDYGATATAILDEVDKLEQLFTSQGAVTGSAG